MTRALTLAATIVALLAGPGSALAQQPEHNPQGKMLGVVKPKGGANNTAGSLIYHNGPVMTTNETYAIFWGPTSAWPAGYTDLISRYFTDVAHDSGRTSNVYSVGTQYSPITYSASFGGPIYDTSKYPSNGCKDHYASICLSDSQLQQELQKLIGTSLPTGTKVAYFIFTPPNVASCGSGVGCAFSQFCAYHSWIGSGGPGTILYANMPYALQTPACDSGQHPNNNSADATLDGASHEHNEMITDPVGTGWFTKSGYEQGDLCNFVYGSMLGSNSFGQYNQLINGNPYWIQEEWSNDGSTCLQRYG